MRVLAALILAGSVVACSVALIDFMLFVNHRPTAVQRAIDATLWTCVRIAGSREIGCLFD